jgi:hypothetical protein
MDQHPVPQDITGFQFKLVGDMTLKQFGYLAAGAIIAWVFYITNWNPIVKMPLTFFAFISGVALAFLPIQERPLETWIVNFFRSVYKPTQYLWKKSAVKLDFLDQSLVDQTIVEPTFAPVTDKTKLRDYLATVSGAPTIDDLLTNNQSPPEPPPVTVDDLIEDRQTTKAFYDQRIKRVRKEIKMEALRAPTIDDLAKAAGAAPVEDQEPGIEYAILDKQQKIAEVEAINRKLLEQIDELNVKIAELTRKNEEHALTNNQYQKQLTDLKKILEMAKEDRERLKQDLILAKMPPPPPAVPRETRVKFADKLPVDKVADGKLPPNTIHGLVDDQNGLAIAGVIVLVKNTAGAPVRALRTNKLGQFLASTPLENGTYIIELEKEGYVFDETKVDLTGATLPPIEIKAK